MQLNSAERGAICVALRAQISGHQFRLGLLEDAIRDQSLLPIERAKADRDRAAVRAVIDVYSSALMKIEVSHV